MKAVECPVCKKRIFSETFFQGEKFPCPHCHQELTVEPYENDPVVKSDFGILETEWPREIWKNNRLIMTEERFTALGQFTLAAMETEKWPEETLAQLKKRLANIQKIRQLLQQNDCSDEFFRFTQSLLDIYIQVRKEPPESRHPSDATPVQVPIRPNSVKSGK